jgi:excisionase family DNA binding protein
MTQEASTGLTFWSTPQVAEILGVPQSTVVAWRSSGVGPTFVRFGKHVRYAVDDVVAWIEENRHERKW